MTEKEKKDRVISGTITVIVMVILFIIMAFCGLKYQNPPPAAKKVILIEMTTEGGGGGGGNPQTSNTNPTQSSARNFLVQQDMSLPSVTTSTKNTTENSANTSQVTEPQPNPNAAYRPGMGGGSGGGTGTGRGSGIGSGIGDGEGSGSGGGIGYGTGSRGYTYMPDLTVNEAGKVYVEVRVDATGKVVDARVINSNKYPTTITNSRIQAECVAKAKTARYKAGKEEFRIIVFE